MFQSNILKNCLYMRDIISDSIFVNNRYPNTIIVKNSFLAPFYNSNSKIYALEIKFLIKRK